ncbi:hypothetical protein CVT24_002489 [Panaeolus cyanescens]|uniref:Uncharacterized protein n=1 Tax=Panaeolus cyanescens TaxID=181874 RepID=A0A409YTN1_9AGAR|nr:hypothetical protein CVT24_002489 [Panaeolus cyanescens]
MGLMQNHGNPRTIYFSPERREYHPEALSSRYSLPNRVLSGLHVLKCSFLEDTPVHLLSVATGAANLSSFTKSRPKLSHLSLERSWPALEALLDRDTISSAVIDFTHLEHLDFNPRDWDEDNQSVQQLIFISGSSLKSIMMFGKVQTYPMSRQLDLSTCTKLENARLFFSIYSNGYLFYQLIDTLKSITNPNSIQKLEIHFYMLITQHERSNSYRNVRWERLDEQLDRISTASSSRRVVCTLHLHFEGEYLDDPDKRDDLPAVVQECAQFAQELKINQLHRTNNNKRIDFNVIQRLNFKCSKFAELISIMSAAILCQELVDLFVDHLVQSIEDWLKVPGSPYRPWYPASRRLPELKQCALVNKAFASRAQKHLFCRIQVHPCFGGTSPFPPQTVLYSQSLREINNLLEIFTRKPVLASHLQHLTTDLLFDDTLNLYKPLSDLMNVLQNHGNPRSLDFSSGAQPSDLKALSSRYSFQNRFLSGLQVLKCGFLEDIPVHFIAGKPNLRILILAYCSMATGSVSPRPLTTARPRLNHLILDHSSSALEDLLGRSTSSSEAVIDFTNLEHLEFTPSDWTGNVQSVQRLVLNFGPSLKTIMMFGD